MWTRSRVLRHKKTQFRNTCDLSRGQTCLVRQSMHARCRTIRVGPLFRRIIGDRCVTIAAVPFLCRPAMAATPCAFLARWQEPPGDQIAILRPVLARKATFLLALIWIGSPVAGLRPMRAARLRTSRMPRPEIFTRSPFFSCYVEHGRLLLMRALHGGISPMRFVDVRLAHG
jgi:hypothetical protein